jgi:hypothetical protein
MATMKSRIFAVAPAERNFKFSQLTDDEGKYRVEAWKLATWKSKD